MDFVDRAAVLSALRKSLPLAFGLLCIVVLARQVSGMDWGLVWETMAAIPVWRWGLAALAAGASFWALAQYDVIAHRHFETGVSGPQARRAGASAIALAQVIGCGPVVAAAVRWRLLPALGNLRVVQLTAFLALSFFAAWGLLVMAIALPVLAGLGWLVPLLLPCLLLGAAALLVLYPRIELGPRALRLPSLSAAGTMLGLTFLDLLFAAACLWLLFPEGSVPGLAVFACAYALALGAGLIGATPGGAGPFELTLIMLLPQTGAEPAVAALLAYRLIYYALPAVLAGIYATLSRPSRQITSPLPRATDHSGERAEHPIAAQSDARALTAGGAQATVLRSPHCLTLFLGPRRGALPPLLPALKSAARDSNRIPVLYKLSARDAVLARQHGWCTALQGAEAMLNPQSFTLAIPERRQLRRALRKAEAAGVVIERPKSPDWLELSDVNMDWTLRHGAERGLTMGRFCPGYLADKPLFVARQNGRAVGFASLVSGPERQSLDLIRHVPDAPTGTMQALIQAILIHAERCGITELSLAGLPCDALKRFTPGADGLTRFKMAFSPQLRPRYIAAPDRMSLLLASADLWRSVSRPDPILIPPTQLEDWEEIQEPQAPPLRLAS